jgi:hypothetical protein
MNLGWVGGIATNPPQFVCFHGVVCWWVGSADDKGLPERVEGNPRLVTTRRLDLRGTLSANIWLLKHKDGAEDGGDTITHPWAG